MKYIYALLIAALALLGACDRFEHEFAPQMITDLNVQLFTPLQSAFNESNAVNLSPVMAYYADDYLHYGINKSAWELTLRTMISGVANPVFEVSMGNSQQLNSDNAIVNWRLKISDPDSKRVIADSTFVGERLLKQNGHWLLKGNQLTCEPTTEKQLVIAEYFTFASCDNCPPAEEKLKALQLQYPQNFIYLEQHTSGPLQIAGETTPSYYGAYSPPVSIFNGMVKVTQSVAASLALYQSQVDQLVTVDTPIRYLVQNPPTINAGVLSCSVKLNVLADLDPANMVLNYVVIEEESPYSNTHVTDGSKLHNVVLARGRMDISSSNLAEPVNFSLNVPQSLPEDARLDVFAQKRPTPFQNNATILGGLSLPL